jgi:hypothetical protein
MEIAQAIEQAADKEEEEGGSRGPTRHESDGDERPGGERMYGMRGDVEETLREEMDQKLYAFASRVTGECWQERDRGRCTRKTCSFRHTNTRCPEEREKGRCTRGECTFTHRDAPREGNYSADPRERQSRSYDQQTQQGARMDNEHGGSRREQDGPGASSARDHGVCSEWLSKGSCRTRAECWYSHAPHNRGLSEVPTDKGQMGPCYTWMHDGGCPHRSCCWATHRPVDQGAMKDGGRRGSAQASAPAFPLNE